jgi:starvation-inducible outer membrane lipoprotein
MKQAAAAALLVACFMLVSCLTYSSALKMELTSSSKTMVGFHQATQRYIPGDIILLN